MDLRLHHGGADHRIIESVRDPFSVPCLPETGEALDALFGDHRYNTRQSVLIRNANSVDSPVSTERSSIYGVLCTFSWTFDDP